MPLIESGEKSFNFGRGLEELASPKTMLATIFLKDIAIHSMGRLFVYLPIHEWLIFIRFSCRYLNIPFVPWILWDIWMLNQK